MIAIDVPKEQLRAFCEKWKVTELAFFGSVTRPEEFGPESDVDVLVRFAEDARWTLFDRFHMQDELSAILRRPVDLLTRRSVEENPNRFIRRAILEAVVPLELP